MAILQKYEAIQFHRAMARGFTSPFLITAKHETTDAEEILVVKSRAGYKNREGAIFKEIFSTLLARELGLHTPEPVIVNLPTGFEFGAADCERSYELIKASMGLNFATIHLGNDWKTWGSGTPRNIPSDDLERIFTFDALIQNADRKRDNPNLHWKGEQVAAFDFDRALAYMDSHTMEKSWRKVIAMLQIKEHVLYSHLPSHQANTVTGQDLWESMEEWSYRSTPDQLVEGDAQQPPLNALDNPSLHRIYDYFKSLLRDPTDFFEYLTAHTTK